MRRHRTARRKVVSAPSRPRPRNITPVVAGERFRLSRAMMTVEQSTGNAILKQTLPIISTKIVISAESALALSSQYPGEPSNYEIIVKKPLLS